MALSERHYDPYSISAALSEIDIMRERAPCSNAEEIRQARLKREQRIDEELAQSFPASDPPSWVQSTSS